LCKWQNFPAKTWQRECVTIRKKNAQ
jgi:hypothetical protein